MSLMTSQAPAREYATRPADERYPSVQAMVDAANDRKAHSKEVTYSARDLQPIVQENEVRLRSPKGITRFTNWAFRQACTFVGAPASYLARISPELARDCLAEGLRELPDATDAVLLVQAPNGRPEPTIRSVTSDTYGRVFDGPLYGQVVDQIMAHDSRWTLPPTWSGEAAGAYMSDRDSFLVIVNGGSMVSDPSLRNSATMGRGPNGSQGDAMYRGLLIRNSEVGASSVFVESILLRAICGNHILWGAMMDRSFRRRHVGAKVERDVVREIARLAREFTGASVERDAQIIRTLIDREIANTKDAAISELRAMGATKEQAEAAYATCEQREAASPRSYWGLAQGFTRNSQGEYQDERFALDQLAAKVLQRGRKLIAA